MRKTTAAAVTSAFFVLAPGTFSVLVPWLLTGWRVRRPLPYWGLVQAAGVVLIAAGAVVLIQAFVRAVRH